ncbi:MAG: glycosyltransferase [Micrococcales bacterium]|nr:glycosyltransferase [Micrococcales bacterium]
MSSARPIRVVHLTGGELGGAEKQLLTLLRASADRTEAEQAAGGRPVEHRAVVIRSGPLAEEFARVVPTVVVDKSGPIDPGFVRDLRHALSTARPDVVQTWAPTPNLWGPLVGAMVRPRPAIVMAEVGLDEWKGRVLKAADKVCYGLSDAVVGNVAEVTRTAVRRGADPGRTDTVLMGVEAGPRPERSPEPGHVLAMGRIDYRKGHRDLLEVWRSVAAQRPEARLTIAGPAVAPEERELERELREIVAADPVLGASVQFVGRVDPADWLPRAAVLVISSVSEGLPNVLMEAYAAAVPVVATSVGGIPDVLVDGESGWLVPPAQPDLLAEALVDALSDPAEAERRGWAGRAVVEPLTFAHSLDNWERIYRRVATERGR